ncbi:MAG: peroxiredoxin [Nitrososphaerales archaeon]|nr:peroxiredoxin [Nitrososphaerales archaeon]
MPHAPKVGERAPEFTLYDADKKERKLSELLTKGRKTILAFFPGAFTGTCTTEMCTFRDMFDELQKLNAAVVGVSVNDPFSNKAFAEKNGLQFPLLCDFKREVTQSYGVLWNDLSGVKGYNVANRAIFVLNDKGNIVYSWVAPNPGTLPYFDEIKGVLK